jgi:CRP-like cAMP-binding protein
MSIEDDISFLESVPLFRLVGRAPLRVLAMGAETQIVQEGEELFAPGNTIDAGYVVKNGRFGLREPRGANSADVAGPGTLLGELALISESARPEPVTALELATVVRIPRSLFLKMLDGYPDAAKRLRDHMAAQAERTMQDILQVQSRLQAVESKS